MCFKNHVINELESASKFPLHILYIYRYFHVESLAEMDLCYGMAVVKLPTGVDLLLIGVQLLPDSVE